MKLTAVIVLLSIGIYVLLPPALPSASECDDYRLGTLDLCRGAAPALTLSGDMNFLHECHYLLPPMLLDRVDEIHDLSFKPLLLTFRNERPPERNQR